MLLTQNSKQNAAHPENGIPFSPEREVLIYFTILIKLLKGPLTCMNLFL